MAYPNAGPARVLKQVGLGPQSYKSTQMLTLTLTLSEQDTRLGWISSKRAAVLTIYFYYLTDHKGPLSSAVYLSPVIDG